ncbi:ephrin type-B receptor 1-like isoform X3 [Heptranchias perlo]|uniref:ephrin type-B receptor 1-like isoform X3 n=1 Tax=Heptranchias perlo TaxID=212740 RepID=UPI0035596251
MDFWLFLWFVPTGLAVDEVLMDTRLETQELNWLVTPDGGWEEAVAVDKKFNTMRTYRVCNVEIPNQDNWLRSGFVQRGAAQQVYVELRFTVRDCDSITNVGGGCRETFALYHRESDSEASADSDRSAAQMKATYLKAQDVTAEHVFSLSRTGKVNKETLRIGPLAKAGFHLAFRDRGACVNLLSVRVLFKKCPPVVAKLARFPETAAGPRPASLVVAQGACVANAEEATIPLKLYCTSEGDWVLPHGDCSCRPGFQGNEELTACTGQVEDRVTASVVPQVEADRGPAHTARDRPCSQLEDQNALLRANQRLLEEQAKALEYAVRAARTLNASLNALLQRLRPAAAREGETDQAPGMAEDEQQIPGDEK